MGRNIYCTTWVGHVLSTAAVSCFSCTKFRSEVKAANICKNERKWEATFVLSQSIVYWLSSSWRFKWLCNYHVYRISLVIG